MQVKKIARRQNQDGGKSKKDGDSTNEKAKLKSSAEKKDDDSESDSSFGNTEQNGRIHIGYSNINTKKCCKVLLD